VTRLRTAIAQFRAAVAHLVKPYRRDFAIGLLATAAANGFVVLIPLAFRAGIDGIVRHGLAAPLLFYGLAVIVLTGCKGWGDYLSHQRIAGMAQRIAYDLRNQIFSHLQSLPPTYFDQANTGDIMSRATSDVEGVRMFIAQSLSTLLEMLFLFTAGLGLMFMMSWQLTFIACVLFPALGYAVVKFRRRIRPRYLAVQEQHGRVATAAGPSGAGKSTIAHLIPRLYDVSAGRVMLHGVDVRALPLADLRRRVALVPQETFLFSVPVADNLAYGRPDAPPEAVHRIAQAACLWPSIQSFPQGLATLVGERGITLSGGQKQRVALARALLYGGEALVLDDPFSNVDAETEEELLETVRGAARDRFVLFITHRIKTLQAADRILVVADGRNVAEGLHKDLLTQGGLYRALYERQCIRESFA
jgi:ABC-type multidrug transport system fused ATPase/permease subunit